MIYFDNAATTYYKPKKVIDSVVYSMQHSGNAGRGLHEATFLASNIVFDCRLKIASFFGINDVNKIVFTNNSTESINTVVKGLLHPNDNVITTNIEHNAVLRPLYEMEQLGVDLSIVNCDNFGNINPKSIESSIKSNTKMVILTHASNVTGNIVDIKTIGEICKNNNIIFVVDASQTAGVIDINVKNMNIDILCFTGHKSLLGPQGTGGIVINTDKYIKPLKSGGTGIKTFDKFMPKELPTHLEAGTLNVHGISGLSAAIDYLNEVGINNIYNKEQELMKYFYNNIKDIDEINIYGDFSNFNRCSIVSLNVLDYDSGKVSDYLYEKYNIATRPKGHCAPLIHKFFKTEEQGMVRFSFCYENTFEEIDVAINGLKDIINMR